MRIINGIINILKRTIVVISPTEPLTLDIEAGSSVEIPVVLYTSYNKDIPVTFSIITDSESDFIYLSNTYGIVKANSQTTFNLDISVSTNAKAGVVNFTINVTY